MRLPAGCARKDRKGEEAVRAQRRNLPSFFLAIFRLSRYNEEKKQTGGEDGDPDRRTI